MSERLSRLALPLLGLCLLLASSVGSAPLARGFTDGQIDRLTDGRLSESVNLGSANPQPAASGKQARLPILTARNRTPVDTGKLLKGQRFVGLTEKVSDDLIGSIASAGFDGIRYYIQRANLSGTDSNNWNILPGAFDQMDTLVDLAAKYKLRVIFDLHTLNVSGVDIMAGSFYYDQNLVNNFKNLWVAIGNRYKPGGEKPTSEDVLVAFELLNEPHPPGCWPKGACPDNVYARTSIQAHQKWNEVQTQTIQAIRGAGIDRPLIVGPGNFSNPESFKDGYVPIYIGPEWGRLVYTFHYYYPYRFTMQGNPECWHPFQKTTLNGGFDPNNCASTYSQQWSQWPNPNTPWNIVNYPGTYTDCDWFCNLMRLNGYARPQDGAWNEGRHVTALQDVLAFQDKYGLELFNGEWDYGWNNNTSIDSGANYIFDTYKLFAARGIAVNWHSWGGCGPLESSYIFWCNSDGTRFYEARKLEAMGLQTPLGRYGKPYYDGFLAADAGVAPAATDLSARGGLAYDTATGSYSLVGLVENPGATARTGLTVKADLLDAQGQVVRRLSGAPLAPTVAAGGRVPFALPIGGTTQGLARYRLSVSASGDAPAPVAVTATPTEQSSRSNEFILQGTVLVPAGAKGARVTAVLYDAAGGIRGLLTTEVTGSGAQPFGLSTLTSAGNSHHYELYASAL